ncbi:MAG: TolC family protein, partial [Acidobacteriales bacterium]|nr:TolC family protein [Terriglobales bacterium]
QGYLATRNTFIPLVNVGSGLAASYGFPLSIEGSAPAIIRVTTQSNLYNPAQRDFIKAAKSEWTASGIQSEDKKSLVILDTAQTYIELDKATAALSILKQQEEAASRAQQLVADRVREGVDSEVELTKAKLMTARVRMRVAENQGNADFLRTRLGQLTGLQPQTIQTSTESIPPLPAVNQDEDLSQKAIEKSTAVKLADEQATAKQFRARGERKGTYPFVDLAGQYGLFSRFNNYDEFFLRFQRHNATFGVVINFPFLNAAQRAKARAADAEATIAKKEAEGVRAQVSAETLRLQRSVSQLAATYEVARLEHQLAQSDVEAVQARIDAGSASFKDLESARLGEQQRYISMLDVGFELDKARMQLLRSTGELEKWALAGK